MDRRATTLNCMDGRVQLPVIEWIKKHAPIDFVDVITEAGMNGVLARQENIDEIIRSINISVNLNKSSQLFIVGHYDCRGNPADEKVHKQEIATSVKRLQKQWVKLEISGLWVNNLWQVEVVVNS